MIGYLGSPGALVSLKYQGGLDVETDRPVSFTRTLGGKRKAFVGRRARREWGVSFDLLGSKDTHGLLAVAQSRGPVLWYPADAVAGNMLSPQACSFEVTPGNATDSGLVSLPDGSVARSVAQAGSGAIAVGSAHRTWEWVPAPQGSPVTVSAWGRGGLSLSGSWRDANGVALSNFSAPSESFSGWQWRSYSANPPTGAVYVTLNLSGGAQYARPVISWGDTAVDRPGRGCPRAVVHGLSEALTVIAQDDSYGSASVTITEVG